MAESCPTLDSARGGSDDQRMIHPLVEARLPRLRQICAEYRVRRLELFGSATDARFDMQTSDLDFLVEFFDLESGQHFETYFALEDALELLFDRPVDLVIERAIRNRYFLESIQPSRTLLYAA